MSKQLFLPISDNFLSYLLKSDVDITNPMCSLYLTIRIPNNTKHFAADYEKKRKQKTSTHSEEI